MDEHFIRSDKDLAVVYAEGLADLNGKRDGLIKRQMTGKDRLLALQGQHPWVLLPAGILGHRSSSLKAPGFEQLEDHEREALRYIAVAIEHKRDGIHVGADAVDADGYSCLYFEQALMLAESIDLNTYWRTGGGRVKASGSKMYNIDPIDLALDILDVCKRTGIAPIAPSPDAPRQAAHTETDEGGADLATPFVNSALISAKKADIWVGQFSSETFNKIGLRSKFPNHAWEAPYKNHHVPSRPPEVKERSKKYFKGFPIPVEDMTEAAAVYDAKRFARQKDLSFAGMTYIVRNPLAALLSEFDLGPIGLVPLPIFEEDLKTPVKDDWYILGLGVQKNTFRGEQTQKVGILIDGKGERESIYSANYVGIEDNYAFSKDALGGADMWVETNLFKAYIYSGRLGQALVDAGYKELFGLSRGRIVD